MKSKSAIRKIKCIDLKDAIRVEDLAILHLSDLHIGTVLNQTLYKLIEDISGCLVGVRKLVIVITGDVVCASRVKEAAELVAFFFERLKEHIPSSCEIVDVELTPGNHDVSRPGRSNRYHNRTYKFKAQDFKELSRRIYAALGVCSYGNAPLTVLDFGKRKICFLRIDSSWHATEEDVRAWVAKDYERNPDELTKSQQQSVRGILQQIDKRSKSQNDYLKNAYDKCVKMYKPALTIAVSHFPLSWLRKSGTQGLRSFLDNNGLAGVDIWMCGHTHTAQMHYDNDNCHAITTLMTGVGRLDYKNDGNEKVQLQRYSIYHLSFERNVCAVHVRVSKRGGEFVHDVDFHPVDEDGSRYNFACLPLKSHVPGGFIRLNANDAKDSRGMFVDGATLAMLQSVSKRMLSLKDRVQDDIMELYSYLMDSLIADGEYSETVVRRRFMDSYAQKRKNFGKKWSLSCTRIIKRCDLFKIFLASLGGRIIEAFIEKALESSELEYVDSKLFQAIGWRVHFRKYCGELTKDRRAILKDEYVSFVSTELDRPGKTLPWGGLLEGAMNHENKCLINSVANIQNHIPTKWSDFLSAIPEFNENIRTMIRVIDDEKSCEENRPVLTYAISMRLSSYEESVQASKILYILEYLKINSVVSSAIKSFLHVLDIDVDSVVRSL